MTDPRHRLARVIVLCGRGEPSSPARWFNTFGFASFLSHIACAFQFYHGWSNAVAYAETARQTAELFGWEWGGGLFINYFFALVWLGETIWSWGSSAGYSHRSKWITWTVRGFFFFMIFNGAVVFVHGAMRWFGAALCLVLVGCWGWAERKRVLSDHYECPARLHPISTTLLVQARPKKP